MKMNKAVRHPACALLSVLFVFSLSHIPASFDYSYIAPEPPDNEVTIPSSDGLNLKADIYENSNDNAPIILLFHQAGYSRGEYRSIAPRLKSLGFTCISIDQRSGDIVNGVKNEASHQAKSKSLGTEYPDAYPDLIATLEYAKSSYPNRKILLWGSSYSSSLVLVMAAEHKVTISGVLSFSPGEYFKFKGKKIETFAKLVEQPVFITSAREEFDQWKDIYNNIPSTNKEIYIPGNEGKHGSKALWPESVDSEGYWEAVEQFLRQFKE